MTNLEKWKKESVNIIQQQKKKIKNADCFSVFCENSLCNRCPLNDVGPNLEDCKNFFNDPTDEEEAE